MRYGYDLVYDIEFVPDLTIWDPPPTKEGEKEPYPPVAASIPIAIGAMLFEKGYVVSSHLVDGDTEEELIRNFLEIWSPPGDSPRDAYNTRLVTYNGRKSDIPVLRTRSMRYGITWGPWYQAAGGKGMNYRFSDQYHLDVYDHMSDFGAASPGTMGVVAQLIGLPGKTGIDGSMVHGLFSSGKLALIRSYVMSDVAQTAFLMLRFDLLRGVWTITEYTKRATHLLLRLESNGDRYQELLDGIDRKVLLLEDAAAREEAKDREREAAKEAKAKARAEAEARGEKVPEDEEIPF